MKRCPACKAKVDGQAVCRRCNNDLSDLISIEAEARHHYRKALALYKSGDFKRMLYHAGRSYSLKKTPACQRLLACSAFLNGDFDIAVSLWKQALSGSA